MPRKRKYRNKNSLSEKVLRLYSNESYEEEREDVDTFNDDIINDDNIIDSLDRSSYDDINFTIEERLYSAEGKTNEMSVKMDKWEKQYKGEWYKKQDNEEDLIFLRKTKEQVSIVYSHILSIVNDLSPLVTFYPIVTRMESAQLEKDRALISEALVDYILNDLVRFKEDILPQFLKSFLKYSMGILKLTWMPDSSRSDFRIENIDRSDIFIDPHAKADIKNASWIIHRYGLPKREVLKRKRDGHYKLPRWHTENDIMGLPVYEGHNGTVSVNNRRSMGALKSQHTTILEDENVEILEYWQSPKNGLSDVYCVMVGGITGINVRYGPNPYPYKNHPFFAKSYDPHELEVDGEGLVQELEDTQKVINTFLNMRVEDVRNNMHRPIGINERLVNDATISDFENRRKLLRFDKDYIDEQRSLNPGYNPGSDIVDIPMGTSTDNLLSQDLPFFLAQSKENTGVTDAFAGNVMDRQVTATQFTNTLSRSTGRMRPVLLQIASLCEELGDAIHTYLKSPEFFGEDRILQITPESKYRQIQEGWFNLDKTTVIRSVSPDDMMVDGTMKAVSGFEDQINKSVASSEIINILQGISLNPDMYKAFSKKVNVSELCAKWLSTTRIPDMKSLLYTDEEVRRNEFIEQQMMAQEQERQIQLIKAQSEARKDEINTQSLNRQAEDQNREFARANSQLTVENQKAANKLENDLTVNDAKIARQTESDIIEMREEARLEEKVQRPVGTGNINE